MDIEKKRNLRGNSLQELVNTTGIILKTEAVGEYDRRVVILTNNHGKISCFARGARRQSNKLMASTDLFCFGDFRLYPGKNAYSLNDAFIKNYFEDLRNDLTAAMYGMYFLEVMDYNTRENNDELDMLKLLYQALRALISKDFDNKLVKVIFELKTMMIMGEFKYNKKPDDNSTALYTLDFLYKTRPEKIFSFKITNEALDNLIKISKESRILLWNNYHFNSEDMIDALASF